MNDLDLLYLFSKREVYEKYSLLVKEHNVSKEVWTIIKDMEVWYKEDETRLNVDWNAFSTWFSIIKHSSFKTEVLDLYKKIFENMCTISFSTIEKDLLKAFMERDYLTRIADHALRGAEGTKAVTVEDISVLVDDYKKESGDVLEDKKYIVMDDIHSLLDHVVGSGGLNWRLPELNLALGPLRKGDFITLTARPDSGKTTMLAAESTFMAKQLPEDQNVIWFNNEEEGRKVKFRVLQAAIAWTTKAIKDNPIRAWDLYEKAVGTTSKILIYDRPSFSIKDVSIILKEYNPGLIIFDQLRKVKGFEKEAGSDVQRLQLIFQQAREWAKEYAPVINVHQARGDAEGQKWIELNQMHGSQTDIQGEVDAVISLGRTHEAGLEKERYIYIPKNKLAGGGTSDEGFRNGKFVLEIQPEIARFKGFV